MACLCTNVTTLRISIATLRVILGVVTLRKIIVTLTVTLKLFFNNNCHIKAFKLLMCSKCPTKHKNVTLKIALINVIAY